MIYPIRKRDVRGCIQNLEHIIDVLKSGSMPDSPWLVALNQAHDELVKLLAASD